MHKRRKKPAHGFDCLIRERPKRLRPGIVKVVQMVQGKVTAKGDLPDGNEVRARESYRKRAT